MEEGLLIMDKPAQKLATDETRIKRRPSEAWNQYGKGTIYTETTKTGDEEELTTDGERIDTDRAELGTNVGRGRVHHRVTEGESDQHEVFGGAPNTAREGACAPRKQEARLLDYARHTQ